MRTLLLWLLLVGTVQAQNYAMPFGSNASRQAIADSQNAAADRDRREWDQWEKNGILEKGIVLYDPKKKRLEATAGLLDLPTINLREMLVRKTFINARSIKGTPSTLTVYDATTNKAIAKVGEVMMRGARFPLVRIVWTDKKYIARPQGKPKTTDERMIKQ